MYLNKEVAHMQYIGFTDNGKKLHALDSLVDFLIEKYKQEKIYLNFGVSTGQGLYNLNEGLLFNKESYGAAPVIQDTYVIDI